jgi:hypothetical protein
MDTDGMIRVGPGAGGQVTLKCQPFSFTVSKGIDETKLTAAEEVSDEVADQIPVEDDDQAEIKSDDEDDD